MICLSNLTAKVTRTYQCMECGAEFKEMSDHECGNISVPWLIKPLILRSKYQVCWRLKEFWKFSDDPLDCCLHWKDNVNKHKYEVMKYDPTIQ